MRERERQGLEFPLSLYFSLLRCSLEFAGSRARTRRRFSSTRQDDVDDRGSGVRNIAARAPFASPRLPLIDFRRRDAARVPRFARHANFRPHRSSPRRGVSRRGPAIDSRALLPLVAPACTYSISLCLPSPPSISLSPSFYLCSYLYFHLSCTILSSVSPFLFLLLPLPRLSIILDRRR